MDFATAQVHQIGANSYAVSHGTDDKLFVEFTNEAVYMEAKSLEEGRAVYEDVPHVHIMFPGDRTREIKRPVRFEQHGNEPADPVRWPRQWAAFKAQEEQHQDGQPLDQWAPMSRAMVMNLKAVNVFTVEQLAGVNDDVLMRLGPGMRDWRDRAQAFIAKAAEEAPTVALAAENADLKAEIALLKAQMAELASAQAAKKKEA